VGREEKTSFSVLFTHAQPVFETLTAQFKHFQRNMQAIFAHENTFFFNVVKDRAKNITIFGKCLLFPGITG